MGKIKSVKDPSKIDTPNKIAAIPKYIGWRLKRNGPETIKVLGFSCGLTVVFPFLKILSVQIFITPPKTIRTTPSQLYSEGIIFVMGKIKCKPIIKLREIKKYVGGDTLFSILQQGLSP